VIFLVSMLFLRVSVSPFQVNAKWEVHAKDTLTLKSEKMSIRYSGVYSDNDVPCSWNVRYLYYFNRLTLLHWTSGVDHT